MYKYYVINNFIRSYYFSLFIYTLIKFIFQFPYSDHLQGLEAL